MKQSITPLHAGQKPLCAAILGGIVSVTAPTFVLADTQANPWAESRTFSQGQTLRLASCSPCATKSACNPCNPCAVKKACNPCNPCAVKKACNPCNPCATKKAGSPCNPCNPCAVKKTCNPCNPCKTSKIGDPRNPCGARRA
jgi:hypothetical protein